jgi:hypothetical protein
VIPEQGSAFQFVAVRVACPAALPVLVPLGDMVDFWAFVRTWKALSPSDLTRHSFDGTQVLRVVGKD